jgi:hypothetical protein
MPEKITNEHNGEIFVSLSELPATEVMFWLCVKVKPRETTWLDKIRKC